MRYPCRFVKSVLGKTGVIKRLKALQKYELGAHYFMEFYLYRKNPATDAAYGKPQQSLQLLACSLSISSLAPMSPAH
jgi:hypothetical protein